MGNLSGKQPGAAKSLSFYKGDSGKLIIACENGLYTSANGGSKWTMDGVFLLICHPENPEIVYSGTYNGVNVSCNFGKHWQTMNKGWPPEQWVFSIDFDLRNPEIMYACSRNGENKGRGREGFYGTVMKSTDEGKNWFEITKGIRGKPEWGPELGTLEQWSL